MTHPRTRFAMPTPISQLLVTLGGSATDTDADLLARFRDRRDEPAFAELVRRHGPLVYGVCRRALSDGPDAEDAFQACFLVLARRIDTAVSVGNLSGWLYRVACLTARKARARRARRRATETAVADLPDVPARVADRDPDLGRVIDEELARLPDKYRTAVVLCELRELTLDEAAAELNCPRGTVASRLSRGRGLLGTRLLRRGLGTMGLSVGAASARVPVALAVRVVDGVLHQSSGVAVQLTQEVLLAMNGLNVKAVVAGLMAAVAVAVGGLSQTGPTTRAAPVPELKAKGPQAELDRVRVDMIGAALACPTIREQLKITAEQDKKLDETWAEVSADSAAAIQRMKAAPGQVVMDMVWGTYNGMDDTVRAFDEKATKVFSAPQLARLRQVQLQRDGVAALLSRHAGRVLKLTAEQEDKIAAQAAKTPGTAAKMLNIEAQAGLNPNAANPQMEAVLATIRRKQAEDFDGRVKAGMAVLTAEQTKAWAELTGAAIPTVELLRAATPFSDTKFVRLLAQAAQQAPPVAPPPPAPVPVEKKK